MKRLAEALKAGPDGRLSYTPPDRLMGTFTRYPDAYAFRIEDRAGRVLGEANSALGPADRWNVPNGPDAW